MIRRPPRATQGRSSAASDVYKRQGMGGPKGRLLKSIRRTTASCCRNMIQWPPPRAMSEMGSSNSPKTLTTWNCGWRWESAWICSTGRCREAHKMSSDKARGWTPEEVIRLRQMVADYATAPELAAAFDRTTSAIYQKLSSLGLKIKRRPEPEPHEWGGTHEIKPRVTVERAVPVSKPLEPAAPPASPGLPTCNDAAHKAGHNAPPASLCLLYTSPSPRD